MNEIIQLIPGTLENRVKELEEAAANVRVTNFGECPVGFLKNK